MSKKLKISYSFFKNTDLNAFAKSVVASLTGNANFPTAQDLVDTLSEAQVAFGNACTAALSRDRNKIAQRNTLRTDLLTCLSSLASLVSSIAQGDEEKLVSSGFEVIFPTHHTTMASL
ncbi:hypothetical protein [Sphingobacterium hungaricum]|uniref:Uncharacterized protein n=1 Tax=Sphingobacterium hungaricum TaxID=2082723 RepID=A0A928UT11_9SPHI|nr:hypothetical protein [Sphingobacterium hungaricum]MBE8712207.1 hypothetical protein [Sphingobacterium hungaricum]